MDTTEGADQTIDESAIRKMYATKHRRDGNLHCLIPSCQLFELVVENPLKINGGQNTGSSELTTDSENRINFLPLSVWNEKLFAFSVVVQAHHNLNELWTDSSCGHCTTQLDVARLSSAAISRLSSAAIFFFN